MSYSYRVITLGIISLALTSLMIQHWSCALSCSSDKLEQVAKLAEEELVYAAQYNPKGRKYNSKAVTDYYIEGTRAYLEYLDLPNNDDYRLLLFSFVKKNVYKDVQKRAQDFGVSFDSLEVKEVTKIGGEAFTDDIGLTCKQDNIAADDLMAANVDYREKHGQELAFRSCDRGHARQALARFRSIMSCVKNEAGQKHIWKSGETYAEWEDRVPKEALNDCKEKLRWVVGTPGGNHQVPNAVDLKYPTMTKKARDIMLRHNYACSCYADKLGLALDDGDHCVHHKVENPELLIVWGKVKCPAFDVAGKF